MDRPLLPPILLWHPKPLLAEGLVEWCERLFPGHPPCRADDAAHALQLAAVARPGVALLDVDTSPRSTWCLIRRLRSIDPPVPSIALTLYPVDMIDDTCRAAGAFACICVAAAPAREFEQLVRRLLAEAARAHRAGVSPWAQQP